MAIHRRSISSTAISSVEYNDETEEMTVTFADGGQSYTHPGVPWEVFDGLVSATSAGRYYHANIKGQY